MTEDDLLTIIRQVIADLATPAPRRALVLFTGGLIGFTDAIESLRRLNETGVALDCIQTQSAERILDQKLIASLGMRDVTKNLVTDHDMLIAPTLTLNVASKVAHGIADCLASNVVSEYLLSNRPVVASKSPVSPDCAGKKQWYPDIPDGYAKMIRGNLAALESFGVHLTGSATLCRTAIAAFEERDRRQNGPLLAALGMSRAGLTSVPPAASASASPAAADPVRGTASVAPSSSVLVCNQHLISQQLVQQLPEGTDLRICPSAVVTALARDIASSRSIRISRED